MVNNHARKNDARHRRTSHPHENHRQAVDAAQTPHDNDPDTQLGDGLVVVVDLPAPDLGDSEPCPHCHGRAVTGEFYAHAYPQPTPQGATALLLDLVCPACRGCGLAEHDTCTPGVHADDDPHDEADYLRDQYDDPDSEDAPCPSCGGRRFNYTQAQGQPPTEDQQRAQQELQRRIDEAGASHWDVTGAAAFGDLDHLLGAGAHDLMKTADTTVYLRIACGCAEELSRTVDSNDLESVNQ
ncbi:hypothetical protein ACIBL6_47510 [Streptomyces sp. NPDC050400]|uniref:hypothetical protein n=1 Tax=Streptomyces sp. NPDC050400 TaxID=3365610 RepID=UPI0037BB9208